MDRSKRKLALGLIAFLCGAIVVVISASTMAGTQSKARLIGIIAGSFGAGVALVNLIRDYSTQSRKDK
jgi:hypothetical protein